MLTFSRASHCIILCASYLYRHRFWSWLEDVRHVRRGTRKPTRILWNKKSFIWIVTYSFTVHPHMEMICITICYSDTWKLKKQNWYKCIELSSSGRYKEWLNCLTTHQFLCSVLKNSICKMIQLQSKSFYYYNIEIIQYTGNMNIQNWNSQVNQLNGTKVVSNKNIVHYNKGLFNVCADCM
jgi:hypothetical protein